MKWVKRQRVCVADDGGGGIGFFEVEVAGRGRRGKQRRVSAKWVGVLGCLRRDVGFEGTKVAIGTALIVTVNGG